MIRFYPTSGDKHGWAIDEDLRLIRRALAGVACESPLWRSDVVHAPFWMALSMHDPSVLRRRFVIAHADNPPFFYLTQPGFAAGQGMVDLWVARSREAYAQFSALGLPVEHIPYAIDESLFFPIPDRTALRRKHGIPEDAYVIGNFHRDSEGADLSRPKFQKAPETFVAILRAVRNMGAQPHVLLAGPRRHWMREALMREDIPFTFVGRAGITGDDFSINILSRGQLNELYNACDLYLVASRWEGGPQSAMEAAAARVKILSYPLGVAADILVKESLFDVPTQAAEKIVRDIREGDLSSTLDAQQERLLAYHTTTAMTRGLRALYGTLPQRMRQKPHLEATHLRVADLSREVFWQWKRRKPRRLPRAVRIFHEGGQDAFLDEAVENLRGALAQLGVVEGSGGGDVAIAGKSREHAQFRLLPAGGEDEYQDVDSCRIALSVQDAVNFKKTGNEAPVVVCPLVFTAEERKARVVVIQEDDDRASLSAWRCLLGGGVPVYPRESAYYYQIFHAGVPYGDNRSQAEAEALAGREENFLRSLAVPSLEESAVKFWAELLSR